MRNLVLLIAFVIFSCKTDKKNVDILKKVNTDFTIAFGSCNNQALENHFWKQLATQQPDVWVWGGDIVYSDTEDMQILAKNYDLQKNNKDYLDFAKNTAVLATWDDHDYGMNDGGTHYPKKKEAQQIFLDFLGVSQNDPRRKQEGVYHSTYFEFNQHLVKVITLDTRYFRSDLDPDPTGKKRYLPTKDVTKTMLGTNQWQWLENELTTSKADFNIIMSSIQVLSALHGFETWGNLPHEIDKLEKTILKSNAKNVILLSGDRHISEFSVKKIGKDSIPLMDFTSSGMTHSYEAYSGEENPFRVGKVINEKSYGLLKFDFEHHAVEMQMWGENNNLLQTYKLTF